MFKIIVFFHDYAMPSKLLWVQIEIHTTFQRNTFFLNCFVFVVKLYLFLKKYLERIFMFF